MDNALTSAINSWLQNMQQQAQPRNDAVAQAMRTGDYPSVLANAAQGIAPSPAKVGAAGTDLLAAAKAELHPSQIPVFERVYAATLNPQMALAKAKELTNLMSTRSGTVLDLARSLLQR